MCITSAVISELEFDDAQDFIRHVEQVVNGVVRRYSPETLVLIKINNWLRVSFSARC
jgi:hypothetical protein